MSFYLAWYGEEGLPPAIRFADDGATFPWYGISAFPAAIYVPSTQTTWIAREAWLGGGRIHRMATYDHSSDTWGPDRTPGSSELIDDDHGIPALFRDAAGYIHWFGGAHNSALRHSATANPDDNDFWTDKGSIGANYAYPHPVFDGTNLYLFLRKFVSGSPAKYTGVLRKSTAISGGSITFAAEVTLVDFGSDTRFYLSWTYDDGTDIHLFATRADAGDTFRRDIYHFRYVKSSGALRNSDGSRTDASPPVDLTTANTYYRIATQATNDTNVPAACIDSNSDFHVCYLDGTGTSFDIKHIIFDGASWSSPTTVATLTNETRYAGLALVALSGGDVELVHTSDPGNDFARGGSQVVRRLYSSGAWGAGKTVFTTDDSHALDNPSQVFSGHTDLRVIFSKIKQSSNDSGAGDLDCYAWGAGGLASRTLVTPDDEVALQLPFDGADGATSTFDESIYQVYIPVTFAGNAQLDTAQKKFGASSLLLDGNGDYLTVPRGQRLNVDNSIDKTMEAWVRVSAFDTGANQTIFDSREDSGTARGFTFVISNSTQRLVFQGFDSGAAVVINISSTATISAGTWYHVAATRSSGTWRIFINGNLEASGAEVGTIAAGPSTIFNIGRSNAVGNPRYFKGHIDMVRVLHGRAEWTASFTPPSSAYDRP